MENKELKNELEFLIKVYKGLVKRDKYLNADNDFLSGFERGSNNAYKSIITDLEELYSKVK